MRTCSQVLITFAFAGLVMSTGGCFERPVTNAELRQAMEELVADGQIQIVENQVLELTTSFTIGQGIEAMAQELRTFIESQIPCSTVQVDKSTLTIDFGSLEDQCIYHGQTFAGIVQVEITSEGDAVVVDHRYENLSNGVVNLIGTKRVVWTDSSRTVTTDYDWTKGAKMVHATSNREQTLLDAQAGLSGGIEINGERHWSADSGEWQLDIDGVEVRWLDPVPQAGVYTLTIPSGKELGMEFSRVDVDTIEVRVTGGRRDHVFHVTSQGAIEDQEG